MPLIVLLAIFAVSLPALRAMGCPGFRTPLQRVLPARVVYFGIVKGER